MSTKYYKLAEKIGNTIHYPFHFCCLDLPKNQALQFAEMFKPSESEMKHFNLEESAWMEEVDKSVSYNNEARVTALLFMDQIVQDK